MLIKNNHSAFFFFIVYFSITFKWSIRVIISRIDIIDSMVVDKI